MPSNAELIEEIGTLAAKLDLSDVKTDGLKNAELAALLSDLRAKDIDAKKDTAADTAGKIDEATEAADTAKRARVSGDAEPAKKPPFYVAPGKAITSLKGILSGDTADEVRAEYFADEKSLDALVAAGYVVKS